MRRLSLVPVAVLLGQAPAPDLLSFAGCPTILEQADLRSALSLMLRTGSKVLAVAQDGRRRGAISLDQIQALVRAGEGLLQPPAGS
jgi:hypothetical protein